MKYLSNQEVFTKIATHLLTQKRKSILDPDMFESSLDNDTGCAYRGVNGLKCAVGALIENKYYHTSLEQKSCGEINVVEALRLSKVNVTTRNKTMKILKCGQIIHDNYSVKYWKEQLEIAALRFKLKMPSIK